MYFCSIEVWIGDRIGDFLFQSGENNFNAAVLLKGGEIEQIDRQGDIFAIH